jgi:hypothetical protein
MVLAERIALSVYLEGIIIDGYPQVNSIQYRAVPRFYGFVQGMRHLRPVPKWNVFAKTSMCVC